MPLQRAAALLLLALVPAGAVAQEPPPGLDPHRSPAQFNVDVWTEDDGLPQNMAAAIAQTPDGYLWLGTEEGLVRFDGVRFRVFSPSNTPALSTPWVTALLADPDGSLWIGTGGGGLVRYQEGAFTATTTEHGLSHDHVRSIHRASDGAVWVGTNGGGVNRLGADGIQHLGVKDGLSSDFVLAIAQDSAGDVWLGTADGLNRVASDGIDTFRAADGLGGDRVQALLAGADGGIWVGTTDGGLTHVRDGEFTRYSTAQGLTSDYVTSLYRDPHGALWIGTNGGGLNRLYGGVLARLTSAENLPGDLVLTLNGDREGNLWLGLTGAGLGRVRDGMFQNVGRPEGLSAAIALAMLEDRQGRLWVGTAGGGLNRLGPDGITTFDVGDGLAHNVVISLAEASNGDVWVGTAAGGITRIRDGRLRVFGTSDGLISLQAMAIIVDREGRLWIATQGSGLQRWDPDNPAASRVYTRADGLPDDDVTTLMEDTAGRIWVGTRSGLAVLDAGGVRPVALGSGRSGSAVEGAGSAVAHLAEGEDGAVWVALKQGIALVTDTVRLFRSPPLDREIHAIVPDGRGFLWLTSNDGVLRAAESDLLAGRSGAEVFGRPDGLRSGEANGGINPAVVRRADGTIWFPTMKGASGVDPDSVRTGRPVPTPILEELVAKDTTYSADRALTLPPSSRTLELHFTAPTFVAPEELHFRYRLDGFDEDWVDAEDRRVAYYTNVPPGSYRFRVATRRDDGPWLEADAPLALTLRPHLYETPWFLALAALALMAAAVAGYRLRVRRLTRRQTQLMRAVAERERTEQALRMSEERLRLALEAGRMGTWEWDLTTDAIGASATAVRILGFSPTSLAQAEECFAEMTEPEDFERLRDIPRLLREERREFDFHLPLTRENGARTHLEIRGRVFDDPDGRPARVAGVVADVTAIMTAQEELRHREEELRQAQKMEAVGRLAGGVAHDFNNLLTAIAGRAQVVLESLPDDDNLREDMEEVHDAVQRATGLTQQLLTFSRKQVHRPRVLDLNAVIGSLERMLRRLIREDVVLETRLASELGQVLADPGGIEQILLNLVVNAQDAMPTGGRVLIATHNEVVTRVPDGALGMTRGEMSGAGQMFTVLSISDTGHGMDAETRAQAFEPFFTTKPVGRGTGLGLSTVYGIVQQSHGFLRLDSTPGRGTRIRIYLPRAGAPESRSDSGVPTPLLDEGSETILLVEDESAVRSLVRKILERKGYRVVDTGSPREALEISRRRDAMFDMLVSDVVMPELGGRELAERIQAIRPDIRVLLMSGYNEDEVLRRGIPGSGMAFIQKPFQPDAFIRRIREILDGDPAPAP